MRSVIVVRSAAVSRVSDVMKNQVVRLSLVVWLVGPAAALHCNICVSNQSRTPSEGEGDHMTGYCRMV